MSVWKRTDEPVYDPPATPSVPVPSAISGRPTRSRSVATIGPSITIHGDVTGEEDLIIEGRVQGSVKLPSNTLTVGESGKLRAECYAKAITVEGEVEGDLIGDEEVIVRPSGAVLGNIRAPRVTLESGCRFKGAIDMDRSDRVVARPAAKEASSPAAARADKKEEGLPLKPAAGVSP